MRISLCLIALSSALAAADQLQDAENFHDIRLTLTSLPTSVRSHLENKSTGVSTDSTGNVDNAGELSIGYQFSHYPQQFGLLIGGNLDFIGTDKKSNGVTSTTDSVGPSLHLGAGFRPVEYFNFEGLLFGGVGRSEGKTKGLSPKDISSASGSYSAIGLEFRAVFTIQPGFQLFAHMGYFSFQQTLKYNSDPSINLAALELTSKADGVMYGLGAGWRF